MIAQLIKGILLIIILLPPLKGFSQTANEIQEEDYHVTILNSRLQSMVKDVGLCIESYNFENQRNFSLEKRLDNLGRVFLTQDSLYKKRIEIEKEKTESYMIQVEQRNDVIEEFKVNYITLDIKYNKEVKRKKRWRNIALAGIPITIGVTAITTLILTR